jgi:hypothetical protein
MDSPIVAAFVRSALLPAFVAALAILGFGFLKEPWKARGQAVILALAFAFGAYLLIGRLNVPPTDAGESFSLAALALAVFVFVRPHHIGHRYLLRGLFVLILGGIVLYPLRQTLFTPVHYRNLLAFFCLALGVWSIVEKASLKVRPVTLILLPLIAATALSLIMLFKASASFSQLVTCACALFGASLVIALLRPKALSLVAIVPFLSVFVILMMIAGHFYLDINPWHMIFLCLPYFVLWIRDWFGFVPQKTVSEALVFGLVSGAPLAYFIYDVGIHAGPLY